MKNRLIECNNPKCDGRVVRKDGLIDYTKVMDELEEVLLSIGWGETIEVTAYICKSCGEVRFFKEKE